MNVEHGSLPPLPSSSETPVVAPEQNQALRVEAAEPIVVTQQPGEVAQVMELAPDLASIKTVPAGPEQTRTPEQQAEQLTQAKEQLAQTWQQLKETAGPELNMQLSGLESFFGGSQFMTPSQTEVPVELQNLSLTQLRDRFVREAGELSWASYGANVLPSEGLSLLDQLLEPKLTAPTPAEVSREEIPTVELEEKPAVITSELEQAVIDQQIAEQAALEALQAAPIEQVSEEIMPDDKTETISKLESSLEPDEDSVMLELSAQAEKMKAPTGEDLHQFAQQENRDMQVMMAATGLAAENGMELEI